MISNLKKLYNALQVNADLESRFIKLLIKFAGYDDEWRDKIENLSYQNTKPFDAWFGGKPRLYFDFKSIEPEEVPIDEEVEGFLESAGYQITDYIKGYCQKEGRQYRIGKVISKLLDDGIKSIKETASPDLLEQSLKDFKNKINQINNVFINSDIRKNQQYRDNLKIVISQDPHDLAKMSYERAWESCMELGEGERHSNVFCEVEEGGFVAYLISGNDLDITHPLARIHIRRFTNQQGMNLALPEESVYGNETPGFLKFIKDWVAVNNEKTFAGNVPAGMYKLQGGEYSDTFKNKIHVITPEKKEELIAWFQSQNLPNTKETTWKVEDNYFDELDDMNYWDDWSEYVGSDYDGSKTFKTNKEAESFISQLRYMDSEDNWIDYIIDSSQKEEWEEEGILDQKIDEIRDNRFSITQNNYDYADSLRYEAVKKLINFYKADLGVDLANAMLPFLDKTPGSNLCQFDLYLVYPDLLSEDRFLKYGPMDQQIILEQFDSDNPKKYDEIYGWYLKLVKSKLDIEGDSFKQKIRTSKVLNSITDSEGGALSTEIIFTLGPIIDTSMNDDVYNTVKKFLFEDLNKVPTIQNSENQKAIKRIYGSIFPRFRVNKMSIAAAIDIANLFLPYIDLTSWEQDHDFGKIKVHDWLYFVKDLRKSAEGFIPIIETISQNAEIDAAKNKYYLMVINENPSEYSQRSYYQDEEKMLRAKELEKVQQQAKLKNEIKVREKRANYTLDCIINDLSHSKKYKWY